MSVSLPSAGNSTQPGMEKPPPSICIPETTGLDDLSGGRDPKSPESLGPFQLSEAPPQQER